MMMKYENRPEIALFLGQLLGESWLLNSTCKYQAPVIVPIPLHPDKMKIRGFNQSELIARGFCDVTGLRLKSNGLMRIKHTEPQFGVSADKRQKNLMGAFDLGKDFVNNYPSKPILLVDDIYTTGATANSAAHTLDGYGINVIGFATVAKAIKLDPQNI
jgi:ComF family protein